MQPYSSEVRRILFSTPAARRRRRQFQVLLGVVLATALLVSVLFLGIVFLISK